MRDPSTKPKDDWSNKLRDTLQKRRPWFVGKVLWVLAPLALLGGFASWWWWPSGEAPRVIVIALDQAGVIGSEVTLHAQIEPQQRNQTASLADLPVVFEVARTHQQPGKPTRTTSAAFGQVTLSWTFPAEVKEGDFLVRHLGTKDRPGTDDQARVFLYPKDSKLILVEVEETLADLPLSKWSSEHPFDIRPRAGAASALQELEKLEIRTIYLALAHDSALDYRKVRGWLNHQIAKKDSFPPGPVLGREFYQGKETALEARYRLVQDLKRRFGDKFWAVAGSRESVEVFRKQDVATFVTGEADIAGATRVASWADVPDRLSPKR